MFSRNKQPHIKSLIAEGDRFEGNLQFVQGLRIDGHVVGDVRCNTEKGGLLVISATARVEGAIHAAHVIVNGEVMGTVFASTLLELQPKARVTGDVHYKALEMHQGATICGNMLPSNVLIEDKAPLKLAAKTG